MPESIWVRCPCCGWDIEIVPSHPKHAEFAAKEQLRLQLEAGNEVCDDSKVILDPEGD